MKETLEFNDRYQLPEHFIENTGHPYYEMVDKIVNYVYNNGPNQKIIDIGCGDGFVTFKLNKIGCKVTGVDYNERGLAFAKAFSPTAEFYQIDLRKNMLKHKFDVGIFSNVLEHIKPEYHQKIAKNISNMIKSKGILLVQVPTTAIKPHKYHYKHFETAEVIELFNNVGFNVKDIWYNYKVTRLSKLIYNHKTDFIFRNPWYDIKIIRKILYNIYSKIYFKAKVTDKYKSVTIILEKNDG